MQEIKVSKIKLKVWKYLLSQGFVNKHSKYIYLDICWHLDDWSCSLHIVTISVNNRYYHITGNKSVFVLIFFTQKPNLEKISIY